MSGTLVAMLVTCAIAAEGGVAREPSPVASGLDVDVRVSPARWLKGAPLAVFAQRSGTLDEVLSTLLDGTGRCSVQLKPGTYVFEVLHRPEPDLLVAVKSEPREITESCAILLGATDPHAVTVRDDRLYRCELIDFAIRSEGPTGELRWSGSSSKGDTAPRLVVSRGRRYFARILARRGKTRYALWQALPAKDPWHTVALAKDLVRCRFDWLATTPERSSSWAEVSFPASQMRLDGEEELELLTNRRFFLLSYGYETSSGKKLVFMPRCCELPPAPGELTLGLGGELTAHAWAAVLKRKVVGKPETNELVWRAGLRDPQGHHLRKDHSDFGWKSRMRMKDGGPVPSNPLGAEELKLLGRPQETIELEVSYDITGEQRLTLIPQGLVERRSPHFVTRAPAEWEFRTRCYLDKLERGYRIIEELRGKPLGVEVRVHWITNKAGWGRAPRRGKSYVMMPFHGLEMDALGWFSHPLHLVHESLHAVGYHHGAEMGAAQARGEKRFKQFRWYVVDHPEYVPAP